MYGMKLAYVFLGVFLAISITSISYALTSTERQEVVSEQLTAIKFTGTYQPIYDGLVQVYTYETICKGFYTVEDNGTIIRYTGFGDLADQYTYESPSPALDKISIASTTDEKIIDTPIDPVPVDILGAN